MIELKTLVRKLNFWSRSFCSACVTNGQLPFSFLGNPALMTFRGVFTYAFACLVGFIRKSRPFGVILSIRQPPLLSAPLPVFSWKNGTCQSGGWGYCSPSDYRPISYCDILFLKLWTGKMNIAIAFKFRMKKTQNSKVMGKWGKIGNAWEKNACPWQVQLSVLTFWFLFSPAGLPSVHTFHYETSKNLISPSIS